MLIDVIVIKNLSAPTVAQIDNGLEGLRSAIQCDYVEILSIDDIDLWFDEEGLLNNKPPNRVLTLRDLDSRYTGEGCDRPSVLLRGTIVLAGHDDEGNTIGLTQEQQQAWLSRAAKWTMLHSVPRTTLRDSGGIA
jgi:hypothetical protein